MSASNRSDEVYDCESYYKCKVDYGSKKKSNGQRNENGLIFLYLYAYENLEKNNKQRTWHTWTN